MVLADDSPHRVFFNGVHAVEKGLPRDVLGIVLANRNRDSIRFLSESTKSNKV